MSRLSATAKLLPTSRNWPKVEMSTVPESPQVNRPLVSSFANCRITAVVSCVPSSIKANDSFISKFGDGVDQVTKMTGVKERRVVDEHQTTSDLCVAAATHLLSKATCHPDEIEALIFVSQTPDYRLPASACELQDRLKLPKNIAAFDVNLGCSGYTYGLWLASSLIASGAVKKVLLLVGDTISKIADEDDRSTAMLFGDCGTATLIEFDADQNNITFVLGTDGSGARNLIVPRGGFRDVSGTDPRNNNRPDRLFMEGGEIFNFTIKAVPNLVETLRQAALCDGRDFDFYLFHQANSFMIQHLSKKAKVSATKVPINIDRFGNTSSATIPLLIVTECRDAVLSSEGSFLGMFGFGVGYSWAACAAQFKDLQCADLVYA